MFDRLSRGDRKILAATGIVFVLLVGLGLWLSTPQADRSEIATTYSTNARGAKAAFLLLQESGYRVRRSQIPPTALKAGGNQTLILADPTSLPKPEEQAALSHFVANGGRIIATGVGGGKMFPLNAAIYDPRGGQTLRQYTALAPAAITRAAPEITMAAEALWAQNSSAQNLYGTFDRPVVVRYAYGSGEVIWWASAAPLTNGGLREPGNLGFFLACLGDKQSTDILWDEYFHGYGQSTGRVKDHLWAKAALAQLALMAAAILLTSARRSGPIRPAVSESRLSPLEFIETLGGLYQHAGAAPVAVDIHYQRFHYWLTRRLGMASNTSVEDLTRAVADRWRFEDSNFASTLREAGEARYHDQMTASHALRLVKRLHRYADQLKLFPAVPKEKIEGDDE
jgi:hypothetical protein